MNNNNQEQSADGKKKKKGRPPGSGTKKQKVKIIEEQNDIKENLTVVPAEYKEIKEEVAAEQKELKELDAEQKEVAKFVNKSPEEVDENDYAQYIRHKIKLAIEETEKDTQEQGIKEKSLKEQKIAEQEEQTFTPPGQLVVSDIERDSQLVGPAELTNKQEKQDTALGFKDLFGLTESKKALQPTGTLAATTGGQIDLWENLDIGRSALYRQMFRITPLDQQIVNVQFMKLCTERLLELLANKWKKGIEVSKYIFQWERGEVTGKYHIQGFVKLKVKIRSESLKKKLQTLFPNCQIDVRSADDESASIRYCSKEETRAGGPWSYP